MTPSQETFSRLVTEVARLALLAGLAGAFLAGAMEESLARLPKVTEESPRNDLTALGKKATMETKGPGLPAHLRRQGDRYIRRWTEAVFQPQARTSRGVRGGP